MIALSVAVSVAGLEDFSVLVGPLRIQRLLRRTYVDSIKRKVTDVRSRRITRVLGVTRHLVYEYGVPLLVHVVQ